MRYVDMPSYPAGVTDIMTLGTSQLRTQTHQEIRQPRLRLSIAKS